MKKVVLIVPPPPQGLQLRLDVEIDLAEAALHLNPEQMKMLLVGVARCISASRG